MEKKAAKALCNFVFEAKDVFENIIYSDHEPNEDFSNEKALYSNEIFEQKYADFEAELASNVRKYDDIKIIKAYLTSIFNGSQPWGYEADGMNFRILELDIESEFLFGLKKNIDNNLWTIEWLAGNEHRIDYVPLEKYINSFLEDKTPKATEVPAEVEPVFESRFDFNALLAESNTLKTTTEKIQLVTNRLFDFKQWQMQSDVYEELFSIGGEKKSNYKYTRKYYPKFEKLCANEIARLQKQIEIEKTALTLKAIEQNPLTIESPASAAIYHWKSSATDFLELFTALYQNNSIERADGKDLTRKEMQEYFQQILGMEIKDPDGKLNKAGGRNENTPFMDNLAQQFRNYVAGKEARISKIR